MSLSSKYAGENSSSNPPIAWIRVFGKQVKAAGYAKVVTWSFYADLEVFPSCCKGC